MTNRMIASGELLRSKSGRRLAPVPQLRLGTDRQTHATLRRIRVWLIEEAQKEAAATNDDWGATLLRGLDPDNFPPADYDTVNHFLFGDMDGPGPDNRIEAVQPDLFDTQPHR